MALDFGYLINQQANPDRTITTAIQEAREEVLVAEAHGYAGVYVSEHHQRSDDYVPSPFPLAAYLAGATSTVRIGVAIALVPLYHPLRLMEDAATVDIVSQGRSILGLGLGYIDRDFQVYGMDRRQAAEMYRDVLPVISRGWDSPIDLRTEGYAAHVERFSPQGPQQPRPPIWIAANTKLGVRLAAEYGDCWIAGARIALERAADLSAIYHRACEALGKTPRVAVIRDAWVADSDSDAWSEAGPHLLRSLRARVDGGLIPPPEQSLDPATWADPGASFRDLSRGRWLVGHPEAVRDEITEWIARVRADEMVVRFKQPSGPSTDQVKKQIVRWNREVAARFA